MTLMSLQHNRSRVPAIPPKVAPRTMQIILFKNDFRFSNAPPTWVSLLTFCGLNPKASGTSVLSSPDKLVAAAKRNGVDVVIHPKITLFGEEYHIKATHIAPRLSPKLVATFPWKLRKLIKQPTQA